MDAKFLPPPPPKFEFPSKKSEASDSPPPTTHPQASLALQVLRTAAAEFRGNRQAHRSLDDAAATIDHLIAEHFRPRSKPVTVEDRESTTAEPGAGVPPTEGTAMPSGAVPSS